MREDIAPDFKEHAVLVTTALYRVTDLWHHDEPLRRDMREKANEIFQMILEGAYDEVSARVLLGYLRVAEGVGRVNRVNFLVLEREYTDMFERVAGMAVRAEPSHEARDPAARAPVSFAGAPAKEKIFLKEPAGHNISIPIPDEINERQRAIIERLRESGMVKISDFFETFGDISSKTIQRDLQDLVARNLIRKTGDKRWTMYMLAEVPDVRYMSQTV